MGILSLVCGFLSLLVGFVLPPLAWLAAGLGIFFGRKSMKKNMPDMTGKKLADIEVPSASTATGQVLAATGIGLSSVSLLLGLFTIFSYVVLTS
ncbi:MAG: hypothetical protein AAFY84_11070 [Pseudomonadota bacterium]